MRGRKLGNEVVRERFVLSHLRGPLALLQHGDDVGGKACLRRQRRVREPFDLRAPLPPDDQDRKLVEPGRHRGLPAQVIEQIEQPLAEHRAADQRVIGSAETDAGNLHDLLAERLLLLVELIHGELRKARLLAGRGLRKHRGGEPAAGGGERKRRDPDWG